MASGRSGSAIAPTVAAATTTTTTAAAPTRCPLARLAHGERTAAERLAVQGGDRRLSLVVGRHLHEREAARPAGLPVGDDLDLLDLAAVLLEERAELRFLGLVGEVPNVQSLSHSSSRLPETASVAPRRAARPARPSSMRASGPSRLGGM